MARTSTPSLRTSGAARMTPSGLEIMAFHLHRFLAGWMHEQRVEQLWITLGFEESDVHFGTFEVCAHTCQADEVWWTFDDLVHTVRHGDGKLRLERRGSGTALTLVLLPIWDDAWVDDRQACIVGFVLIPELPGKGDYDLVSLSQRAGEAVSAARRNAVRLFFDEHKELPIKRLIYGVMEHLPEWSGCDRSGMMVLTSTLETITMESAHSHFSVLAESAYTAEEERFERLVGLTIAVDDVDPNVMTAAFLRQRSDPDLPYQVFVRVDDEHAPDAHPRWRALDDVEGAQTYGSCHRAARPDEGMYVLVPLVAHDGPESELLGFLAMVFREPGVISDTVAEVFFELGAHLAPLVRSSSLYTLSARKLWILRSMRRAAEESVASGDSGVDAVERLIGRVSQLIVRHVEVPSFGIAYLNPQLSSEETGRVVRYVHPHGWAHLDQLNLPIDVTPDQLADSGVSALAVRLRRPLVLAGGHGAGEEHSFKNSLHVHEASGQVLDRRGALANMIVREEGWVPLSDYYKPVRTQAYATIAYPILFAGHTLGVLTIEVDKDTNWLWWTGFGGHLFWQLVTSELANAYWALGIRPTPGVSAPEQG